MDPRNAALAYRHASIENAPPIQIVRLLYEGAIRYVDRAHLLLTDGGQPQWIYWSGRAHAIVEELRIALDETHGTELCRELDRLYEFVQNRLDLAVRERKAAHLAEARKILATLLEGWTRVEVDTLNGA
jgi:flagellar secretion chaperone FliS